MRKFVNAWNAYEKLKVKQNCLDYSDLNKYSLKLLREHPEIAGDYDYIVVDDAWTTTRIIEDFQGKSLTTATFSSPVRLTGFNKLPQVGSLFTACGSKKEAEEQARICEINQKNSP
jgi:superfamily I DNA/RNA helicase